MNYIYNVADVKYFILKMLLQLDIVKFRPRQFKDEQSEQ